MVRVSCPHRALMLHQLCRHLYIKFAKRNRRNSFFYLYQGGDLAVKERARFPRILFDVFVYSHSHAWQNVLIL